MDDCTRVYDGIQDYDCLCYIALLAQTMPRQCTVEASPFYNPYACESACTGATGHSAQGAILRSRREQ